MRRSIITAALGGLIAAATFGLPAHSAENAKGIKQAVPTDASSQQRKRTRITVRRRSYLNVGTESLPGDHKYMDYAFPPTYSVTSVIDRTGHSPYDNNGLPGPFDLPSKRNPRQ